MVKKKEFLTADIKDSTPSKVIEDLMMLMEAYFDEKCNGRKIDVKIKMWIEPPPEAPPEGQTNIFDHLKEE